jgi:hypothetical protein
MHLTRAGWFVVFALLAPSNVFAWGNDGHRAVAALALERLDPAVAAAVASLLSGEDIRDASKWADRVKHTTHKHTRHSHYVDIPVDSSGYDPARDCGPDPEGVCILKALPRVEATLRDSNASAIADARSWLAAQDGRRWPAAVTGHGRWAVSISRAMSSIRRSCPTSTSAGTKHGRTWRSSRGRWPRPACGWLPC